jgi:flagellar hook-length control protein FliK
MRSRAQDNLAIQGGNNKLEAKATASEQSARSRPTTRPQLTRMLERVESTLKEVARSRDGKTISLKLEPVDLGRVKVDVSLRDGVLHARISPDSQQVMTALREHAHELQGTLRKLGLEVDSVTVSVTADEFSNQMNGGNGGANSGSSFRDERHNMPNSGIQVPENMNGNELAAGVLGNTEGTSSAALIEDHWVA